MSALTLTVALVIAGTAQAEVKMAVVDVQRAILSSEEAKRLLAQIQTEFKNDEERIRTIQTEAAAMLERAQKDAEVMSDTEKRKLQQQIEGKTTTLFTIARSCKKRLKTYGLFIRVKRYPF